MLSRIWLTYRRLFPSLGDPSDMTSDRGWGCMLRCGQMLLAEALVRLNLGRSWRWTTECSDENYLRIVRLFEDQPSAPYSLHVMTSLGQATGKNIGEWYGPNTVAHLIRRLRANEEWSSFAVSVPINNVMIVDQTRALSKKSDGSWKPLLLLLPLRLGVDTLNDIYIETLKRFFHVPQGLGILGGAPSKALFLIGYVGQDVLYLDPHTTQDSVSVGRKETSEEQQADLTYHCRCTPRMPFIRLDPSIAMVP
ncbi:cysteine protease ATG4B-like, partial [Hyalella azteca]